MPTAPIEAIRGGDAVHNAKALKAQITWKLSVDAKGLPTRARGGHAMGTEGSDCLTI